MKIKINKMPTTIILLVFSWLIAGFGAVLGVYLIILKHTEFNSLIQGILILLGSLLLAGIIRTLGNIGQVLFDLQSQLQTQNSKLEQNLQSLQAQLQTQNSKLLNNLETLNNILEQINCDSKDINQNINQIRVFFEQIERHLDLKK